MIDIDNLLEQIKAVLHVMDEKGLPIKGREIYLPYHSRDEFLKSFPFTRNVLASFSCEYQSTVFGIPLRFLIDHELSFIGIKQPCVFWRGEINKRFEKNGLTIIVYPIFSLPLRMQEKEEK